MSLFKRRKRQSYARRFRELLWPSMGWVRLGNYYRHRMFRMGDSTYKVTAGLAAGIGVSFTPFLGTHFMQGIVLAMILRGNWIASAVGTAWGNPWTFPFIFTLTYHTGIFLCRLAGYADFVALPPDVSMDGFLDDPFAFMAFLYSHPMKFLLPMTVGGYVWCFLSLPLSYAILYFPVRAAQRTYRRQRLARRIARRPEPPSL